MPNPFKFASLNWGIDDMDGTVVYYDITKSDRKDATRQELTLDKIKHLIVEAGGEPIERDTLYHPVRRNRIAWQIETTD